MPPSWLPQCGAQACFPEKTKVLKLPPPKWRSTEWALGPCRGQPSLPVYPVASHPSLEQCRVGTPLEKTPEYRITAGSLTARQGSPCPLTPHKIMMSRAGQPLTRILSCRRAGTSEIVRLRGLVTRHNSAQAWVCTQVCLGRPGTTCCGLGQISGPVPRRT